VRKLLVRIKTSFGSCMCDYAEKTVGDTSATPVGIVRDSMKDDKLNKQEVEEGKQRVSSL